MFTIFHFISLAMFHDLPKCVSGSGRSGILKNLGQSGIRERSNSFVRHVGHLLTEFRSDVNLNDDYLIQNYLFGRSCRFR